MAEINAVLKVSVDDLRRASADFGNYATETKKLTNEMLELIRNTKNVWQGDARDAYSSKFDSLSGDMERIYKMIDEYRLDLDEIAKNYESTETSIITDANALKSDVVQL